MMGGTQAGQVTGSDGRVPWVDVAKGLCIVLVVMMHSTLGVGEVVGREGFLHTVVAFARPFRMPDFFLVAGLFLSRVIARDWRAYADKRVVHFLYFYVLWLLIQSAFKVGAVSGGTVAGFVEHLAFSLIEPFGTLWFIYLLAVFSVVTRLLRGLPLWLLLGGAAILEIAPVETGWTLIDEFCGRYVYFVAGYALAPRIFALAEWVRENRASALAGLALWAVVNGVLAFTPTPWEPYPNLARLPFASLALGALGAMAVVSMASLITGTRVARPFAYAGQHSIAVYLAFFLPMAVTRTVLIKSGLINDVGWISVVVTSVALVTPLVLERLVRHTPLSFLFRRPRFFHLRGARPGVALQPAE